MQHYPIPLIGPAQQPGQGCPSLTQEPHPLASSTSMPEQPCTEVPAQGRAPTGLGSVGQLPVGTAGLFQHPLSASNLLHALLLWHGQKVDELSFMWFKNIPSNGCLL